MLSSTNNWTVNWGEKTRKDTIGMIGSIWGGGFVAADCDHREMCVVLEHSSVFRGQRGQRSCGRTEQVPPTLP